MTLFEKEMYCLDGNALEVDRAINEKQVSLKAKKMVKIHNQFRVS